MVAQVYKASPIQGSPHSDGATIELLKMGVGVFEAIAKLPMLKSAYICFNPYLQHGKNSHMMLACTPTYPCTHRASNIY